MNGVGLYRGRLWHRRDTPAHSFTRDVLLARVDVAAVDAAPGGVLSLVRGWPIVLRAKDHLPATAPGSTPLATRVHDLVSEVTGKSLSGSMQLVSQPRAFGMTFDPASFIYCYEKDRVECVVVEVTNTPWGERHAYVLPRSEMDRSGVFRCEVQKAMHVSPFFEMDHMYSFEFSNSMDRFRLTVTNRQRGNDVFCAGVEARGVAEVGAPMSRAVLRHSLMPFETALGIYSQAARLAWKRAPFYPHPRKQRST